MICSVDGCAKPVQATGLCFAHYQRKRRHGSEHFVQRITRVERGCAIEGCNEPHAAKGLCKEHYSRLKSAGHPLVPKRPTNQQRFCSIEDCNRVVRAKGLCAPHYYRPKRKVTLPKDTPVDTRWWKRWRCSEPGCSNEFYAKKFCRWHYEKKYRRAEAT